MEVNRVAASLALEAGKALKERLGDAGKIEYKGDVDLVTEMDRFSEELIVKELRRRCPEHGVLAEEGDNSSTSSGCRWIIDPLDGTTNYAHGFPFFCVSIAFEEHGTVSSAVVYDPMREELFSADKGRGARLNGKPIHVSETESLDKSLIATGFPYDIRSSEKNNLGHFSDFAVRAQAIRRAGAAALDLCYVGCGRFDGFWELKLKPWDLAAGALIVEEAGGSLSSPSGGPFTIYDGDVVASNGKIHEEMLSVLNS